MIVANAAPIAFRRRFPMSVALVSAVAFAATQLLQVPEVFLVNFTLFIALYTVGAWCSDRVGRSRALGRHRRHVRVAVRRDLVRVGVTERPAERHGLPVAPYVAISLLNILINVIYFGCLVRGQPGLGLGRGPAPARRTHRGARGRTGA